METLEELYERSLKKEGLTEPNKKRSQYRGLWKILWRRRDGGLFVVSGARQADPNQYRYVSLMQRSVPARLGLQSRRRRWPWGEKSSLFTKKNRGAGQEIPEVGEEGKALTLSSHQITAYLQNGFEFGVTAL